MKKHSGMRPHDIAVLIKILSISYANWLMKDLATRLFLSQSEISDSKNRSILDQRISSDKRTVYRLTLLDFLQYGLWHVFPQRPKHLDKGLLNAYSASLLKNQFNSNLALIWLCNQANTVGLSIEPLYKNLALACLQDKVPYENMSLIEAIRVGKVREINMALRLLRNDLLENKAA